MGVNHVAYNHVSISGGSNAVFGRRFKHKRLTTPQSAEYGVAKVLSDYDWK